MPKHKLLYDYLTERAEDISQTWFDTLHETDPDSVYASTDPAVLTNLKKQNLAIQITNSDKLANNIMDGSF